NVRANGDNELVREVILANWMEDWMGHSTNTLNMGSATGAHFHHFFSFQSFAVRCCSST
ncbi:hypothetical protein A2U01_0076035, partial [Trifolium medium]|nr:hypothetical protein [Trifolium medium]